MTQGSKRRNCNRIETHIKPITIIVAVVMAKPHLGSTDNSFLLRLSNGVQTIVKQGPVFHLNENDKPSPAGNQVNFSGRTFPIARQNTIAFA